MENELPNNTIRINKAKLLRSPVFWIVLLVIQFALLYGAVFSAYHASKLPYWFDNTVQSTGTWRIFGTKTYEPAGSEALYVVDPRISEVVNQSSSRYGISGFVKSVSVSDGEIQDLELAIDDSEPFTLEGSYQVNRVLYKDCFDSENCGSNALLDGDLENVRSGQLVEIWLENDGTGGEWYIDVLIVQMNYE